MKKKQTKKRFVLILFIYLFIAVVLIHNVGSSILQIYKTEQEKKEFEEQLVELKEKEEELKGTVTKLQDPDYIARYAREKYLYSKDGEIIIRIPD